MMNSGTTSRVAAASTFYSPFFLKSQETELFLGWSNGRVLPFQCPHFYEINFRLSTTGRSTPSKGSLSERNVERCWFTQANEHSCSTTCVVRVTARRPTPSGGAILDLQKFLRKIEMHAHKFSGKLEGGTPIPYPNPFLKINLAEIRNVSSCTVRPAMFGLNTWTFERCLFCACFALQCMDGTHCCHGDLNRNISESSSCLLVTELADDSADLKMNDQCCFARVWGKREAILQ